MLAALTGCASISRGITEAIMQHEVEDERRCWIAGRSFDGLNNLFRASAEPGDDLISSLKIMTVHGIGSHVPGYSRRLINSLVSEFHLTRMAENVKTVPLAHPDYDGDLGILSVYRYMNDAQTNEVLFFELTWDSIIEEQVAIIDYDNGQEPAARRVPLNHTMKTFLNKSIPDALAYNTRYREPIQIAVAQSACWMLTGKWEDLPNGEARYCDATRPDAWSRIDNSSIAIISHSLGSRISMDAIQATLLRVAAQPELREVSLVLKNKPVYLYMLSNQLPLLQVGQPLPEVHGQIGSICGADGRRRDERLIERLQIVAFSDPNDLFSYTVKPAYLERYVDSRLCPTITNVVVEVAPVTKFLGAEAFANPQSAHSDYDTDSRVLKMLVSGFGPNHGRSEVRERCEFIEAIPEY
jgi:hypothetical protein